MSVQITPKLLKKLLVQTRAEQVILYRDDELIIGPPRTA